MNNPTTFEPADFRAVLDLIQEIEIMHQNAPAGKLKAQCAALLERAKQKAHRMQQNPEVPHATVPPFCAPVPITTVTTLRESIVAGMK